MDKYDRQSGYAGGKPRDGGRREWGYDVDVKIGNSYDARRDEKREKDDGWTYPVNSPYINYTPRSEESGRASRGETEREVLFRREQLRREAVKKDAARQSETAGNTGTRYGERERREMREQEKRQYEQMRREAARKEASRQGAPKHKTETSHWQITRNSGNGLGASTPPKRTFQNGVGGADGEFSPYNMSAEQKKRYEKAYFEKYGRSPYERPTGESSRRTNDGYGQGKNADAGFYYGNDAWARNERIRREEAQRARAEEEAVRREQIRRDRAQSEQVRREQAKREEWERRKRAERERAHSEQIRRENMRREAEERARREAAEKRRQKAEARRRAEEKIRRKRHRRLVFKRIKFHTVIVAVAIVITAAIAFAVLRSVFWGKGEDTSKSYSYTFGSTDITGVSAELATPDGDIRINFTALAEYCGFHTVGDGDSLKYVVSKGDENDSSEGTKVDNYVIFKIGSRTADVNGTEVVLSSESVFIDSALWVSDDIMDCFASGISYSVSGRHVSADRIVATNSSGTVIRDENGNATYEDFKLKYGLNGALDGAEVGEDEKDSVKNPINGTASEVTFNSDLSAYEEYMNPEDATPYLVLVNKVTTVDETFVPENLVDVKDTRQDGRVTQQMVKTAEMALEAMFAELRACGYTDLSVTSGYRTYAYQSQLFNSYINDEMAKGLGYDDAKAEVLTYSAAPGTSEHQTGLCCDMHNLGAADQAFANEEAYTWLKENCWKFGFIIRFPEGKESVTGYEFEPWHYRFVGRYTAEKIMKGNMCLEEYLELIGNQTAN